jgi:L-lactate dehydrogenase complex protein LldE
MKIALFVPCLVDRFRPEIAESAARVLTRAGCRVEYPAGQTCCGQPLYKAGHAQEARKTARHWLRVFRNAETVVAPSGSCVAMVRSGYPRLFEDDPAMKALADEAARRTYEFCEFMVDKLGAADAGAEFDSTAVYHDSCQVGRALGVRRQPLELLSNIRGLKLFQMSRPETCCGFGGTFSVQFPEVSASMTEDKLADIEAAGAEIAVTAEPSCLINLESMAARKNSRLKFMHIAELLDRGAAS